MDNQLFQYQMYRNPLQAMLDHQNMYGKTHYVVECKHGENCPVCRAEKEAYDIENDVKKKEYQERCKKYMEEFREKRMAKR